MSTWIYLCPFPAEMIDLDRSTFASYILAKHPPKPINNNLLAIAFKVPTFHMEPCDWKADVIAPSDAYGHHFMMIWTDNVDFGHVKHLWRGICERAIKQLGGQWGANQEYELPFSLIDPNKLKAFINRGVV